MYVKLLGAGICFALSLFNVLGAMQRVPIKTSVGDSSRPAVAMMKPPGANLNWLSGGVFFAASISLIAWAIWDYNSNVDLDVDLPNANNSIPNPIPPVASPDIQMPQYPGEMESNNIETQLQGGVKPLNQNIIPFRRTADGSVPITPKQFKSALEEEDYWNDK
ncbi:MAG: hypothetical protein WBA41_01675 [Rivularia sp. (in: cyanobacteria)]